jgi:hypothetical protein
MNSNLDEFKKIGSPSLFSGNPRTLLKTEKLLLNLILGKSEHSTLFNKNKVQVIRNLFTVFSLNTLTVLLIAVVLFIS